MNKKLKGFSLAELLISLLIISIVLSAAIPTVTRRMKASDDVIWRWSGAADQKTNAFYGAGEKQSAIIGTSSVPSIDDPFKGYVGSSDIKQMVSGNYQTEGNKLVLFKKYQQNVQPGKAKNMITSHIAFYNLANDGLDATTNDIEYAGRIAVDKHNIAFGIGTLHNLAETTVSEANYNGEETEQGFNTAIGHYSLFANRDGRYNTGLGEHTLSQNLDGKYNTAIGFGAGQHIRGDFGSSVSGTKLDGYTDDTNNLSNRNTVMGAYSLHENALGYNNTAIGAYSLLRNDGADNTAIGSYACSTVQGNNNICIGANSGAGRTEINNLLTIGSDQTKYISGSDNRQGGPLISGYQGKTTYNSGGYTYQAEKTLDISTKLFNIKTFDSKQDIFTVNIFSGSGTGYTPVTDGVVSTGEFTFTLGEEYNSSSSTTNPNPNATKLSLYSNGNTASSLGRDDSIVFDTNDSNLTLNNQLNIKFNQDSSTSSEQEYVEQIYINTDDPTNNNDITEFKLSNVGLQMFTSSDSFATLSADNDNFQIYTIKKAVRVYAGNDTTGMKDISLMGENITFSHTTNGEIKFETAGDSTNYVTIAGGEMNVTGEIYISGIRNDSGVKNAINDLYNKIDDINNTLLTYSDERLKNIQGVSNAGLKEILALEVKNYTYKNDKEKTPHVGVIAQQLQKIFPNSVTKDKDGYLKIKTEEIFYAMVNSIKELYNNLQDVIAKVSGLDKRISELEKENKNLKKQNEEIEKRLAKLEKALK